MPNPNHVNPRTGHRYGWEAEQAKKKAESPAAFEQELALLERLKVAAEAREDLLPFIEFTMPDPEDPNDVSRSSYRAQEFHKQVAKVLVQFERGELRHADGRLCKQIIFAMPPRHGKTQMATKHFSAWLSGRHPEWNIAVGTYSDGMAEDIGGDTRAIMGTSQFKQVFPGHRLRKGSTAKANFQTEAGGRLVFVGRGGPLTGKGANCFPAGTKVTTDIGDINIEELSSYVGRCRVLSFDKTDMRLSYEELQAFAERPRSRLYRITTSAGRVVEATEDHPFWVGGEYKEVRALAPGDVLLRRVRSADYAESLWHGCSAEAGDETIVLRSNVLLEEPRTKAGRSDEREGCAGSNAGKGMRSLQPAVHAEEGREKAQRLNLLRASVREHRSLGSNGGRGQPEMEGQRVRAEVAAARAEGLSDDPTGDTSARRPRVRGLRGATSEKAGSSPPRQRPDEQHRFEFGDAMQSLSQERARGHGWELTQDAIVSIEDTGRDAVVYDIQVGRNHNFFANGLGCSNCLLLDDLYKDHEEARSQTIRDQAWNWFTKVAMTRRMGRKLVMLTMTRWHSDDVIGRLTDPENPCYNAIEAKDWMIIRIPAIAEEGDVLGRAEGEPLWPEEFDLDFLMSQQRLDPLGFAALYQQRPTVADGVLFRRENIQRYDMADLPDNLRFYCTSDHAVGTKQRNDPSCFGKAGVDKQDNLWLVDLFWKRVPTDQAVEAMLAMASGTNAPLIWWAERGHISQSIGPFLYKRMAEEGVYINLREVTPVGDKEQRAQSIAARVAMGKVYIPKGPMWDRLVEEMLAFPNGIHDDGVDMLSLFGLGLQSQFGKRPPAPKKEPPKFGTLNWVKAHDRWSAEQAERRRTGGF